MNGRFCIDVCGLLGEVDGESDGIEMMMMMLELESRGIRDHDEVGERSQSAKGD